MNRARALGMVGLVALSECSLLFDPAELGNGASIVRDAMADAGEEASADAQAETAALLDASANAADAQAETAALLDTSANAADEQPLEASAPFDAIAESVTDAASLEASFDAGAPILDEGADAVVDAGADAARVDAARADAAPIDAGPGSLGIGLLAFYPFDEASGTTAADGSGNGYNAVMNGATFAPGLRGNAASLNGAGQYVSLPVGIVGGLTSCSVSLWVNLVVSSSFIHIFDFGTGLTTYMSLTSPQFAITVAGQAAEERIRMPTLPSGTWRHVVLTLDGAGVGTMYVNGAQIAQNSGMTLSPSNLGTTTRNWLGRSQDPTDAYLNGQIDQVRIYTRALTAAEVLLLFQLKL